MINSETTLSQSGLYINPPTYAAIYTNLCTNKPPSPFLSIQYFPLASSQHRKTHAHIFVYLILYCLVDIYKYKIGDLREFTHIYEVGSKPLLQVGKERILALVVLQQHEVLHSDVVSLVELALHALSKRLPLAHGAMNDVS